MLTHDPLTLAVANAGTGQGHGPDPSGLPISSATENHYNMSRSLSYFRAPFSIRSYQWACGMLALVQRVGPRPAGVRSWPGVAHSPRSGPDTQASLIDKLTALANAMELFCSLQIQYERQVLDLHVQEEQIYFTTGTESDITLTFGSQTAQQEYIDTFSLGCTGSDAAIASLINTGVTGYVKLGGFVVNFNVPSVTDTELDILLTQSSVREIHLFTNTGDFPAGLTFYGMLTGRVVPSSIPNVEHGGVLH